MKINKIIIKNAIKIYLSIVLFFFLMKLLKLDGNVALRMLNFVFVILGMNKAIKENIYKNRSFNYFHNLIIGFKTSILAVIFTFFSLLIYLYYINPYYIHAIENLKIWGTNLNPEEVSFAILIEGLASSLIGSFILMQYWKTFKIKESKSI